jgi:hypothetical protein
MISQKYIFAPFTKYTKTVLINYSDSEQSYRVTGFPRDSYGFGLFRLIDDNCARFITISDYSFVYKYLNTLPALKCILAYESDLGWIAYPQSVHVMKSELAYDREIVVRNVEHGKRFDVVKARLDGMHWWYDIHDANNDKSQHLREVFNLTEDHEHIFRKAKRIPYATFEDLETMRLSLISRTIFNIIHKEDNAKMSYNSIVPGKNVENNWKYKKLNQPHKDINALSLGFSLDAKTN